jgi:small subunit ribosomal protein S16
MSPSLPGLATPSHARWPGTEQADAVVPTRRGRCLHPSFLGETTPVAVKIKLKRMGKIHAPFYRIIVADARTKRDGRAIEEIGKYHPKNEPSLIEVDSERAQHWLSVGAQPTDPVRKILEITGDWQKFKGLPGAEGTLKAPAAKADKKDAYAAAVAEAHGTSTDGAKGKGRSGGKQAGKAADDQADGDAGAAKSAPARSGARKSAGSKAKADTATDAKPAKADTAADAKPARADTATDAKPARADTAADEKPAKADGAKPARAETAADEKPTKADGAKPAKAETATDEKPAKADGAKPAKASSAKPAKADAAKAGQADEAKADSAKADSAKADSAKAAGAKGAGAKAAGAKASQAAKAEDSAGDKKPAASATEQGNGA